MNLQDYISRLSGKYGIPSQITQALALIESGMRNDIVNYEPLYQWLWDCDEMKPFRNLTDDETLSNFAPMGFTAPIAFPTNPDAEYIQQKMTWGPFQQYGACIREAGYQGPFITLANCPETATHFMLIQLSKLRDKYFDKHGWAGVMAAYDAGRPRKTEDGQYVNRDFLIALVKNGAKGLINYT